MSAKKKSRSAVSIVLISLGIALIAIALTLNALQLTTFSSLRFSEISHTVKAQVHTVCVEDLDCNIVLRPSQDGKCRVVTQELSGLTNAISVQNGVLTVKRQDTRPWHSRILVLGATDPTLTVYLPAGTYREAILSTVSGDIETDAAFAFQSVNMTSVSGSITLLSHVTESAHLTTSSGDLSVTNQVLSKISAHTSSGSLTMQNVAVSDLRAITTAGKIRLDSGIRADNLVAETQTGDVFFRNVYVKEKLTVITQEGNVAMLDTDVTDAYMESVSGNIMGTLKSAKRFDVQTESGFLQLPKSAGNALFTVRTKSGSVAIDIKP